MADVVLKLLPIFEGTRLQLLQATLLEFRTRWNSAGCADALEKARVGMREFFANQPSQWSRQDVRAAKVHWEGCSVSVNQSGIVSVYWETLGGKIEQLARQANRYTDHRA